MTIGFLITFTGQIFCCNLIIFDAFGDGLISAADTPRGYHRCSPNRGRAD